MEEYRHIFLDETSNSRLSNNTISSGLGGSGESGAEIKTGANVVTGVTNQLKTDVKSTLIDQPLNAVTGGLWSPASQAIKQVASGMGAIAFAGGITAIAFKGVELLVQQHEKRIVELEKEAKEANNADNVLIKAGSLNVTNATITYNKYGRAVYKYDRS